MPTIGLFAFTHKRFVHLSNLDEQEQHAADAYLNRIRSLQNGCVASVEDMQQRGPVRRQNWDVSISQRNAPPVEPKNALPLNENPPDTNTALQQNGSNLATSTRANAQQHQQGASVAGNLDETSSEAEPFEVDSAKRRKLDLEFQFQKKNKQSIQQDREQKNLQLKYDIMIEKLISSGTTVPVSRSNTNDSVGSIWYLSHFFVSYPNKPDKIRVVFDAAARFQSLCYNDLLLRGPPSIPSLVGVLLRARQFRVALSADITAFYHLVGVAK